MVWDNPAVKDKLGLDTGIVCAVCSAFSLIQLHVTSFSRSDLREGSLGRREGYSPFFLIDSFVRSISDKNLEEVLFPVLLQLSCCKDNL